MTPPLYINADATRIVCGYSDRGILTWTSDATKLCVCVCCTRAGCVDLEVCTNTITITTRSSHILVQILSKRAAEGCGLPEGSLVTCSADQTVRIWRPPTDDSAAAQQRRATMGGAGPRDLLRVLCVEDEEKEQQQQTPQPSQSVQLPSGTCCDCVGWRLSNAHMRMCTCVCILCYL